MTAVIATAPVMPLLREPSVRSEQVTQAASGRTGRTLETRREWRRVRLDRDGYEGWTHDGYLRPLSESEAARWRSADGWSEGAVVDAQGRRVRLPLGARALLHDGVVELATGLRGRVIAGRVLPASAMAAEARALPVAEWACRYFEGTGYEWGGVTPWGVDCSGLVQTGFAARGIALPRDSGAQAECGVTVSLAEALPGDLLFFSDSPPRVTHVAILHSGNRLVHAALSAGGFVVERWGEGTRAGFLRRQFVTARRIAPSGGPAL